MKGRLMILSHRIKGRLLKYKWYSWKWQPFNRTAVFVSDGRFFAGGLADRFKGMVSLYAWAKKKRVPFRIEHTVPFQLTQYLVPNEYDWIPKDGDLVRTVWSADIVYAVREPNAISRMSRKACHKQAHFYGNRDLLPSMNIDSDQWGVLFKELFKPTGELQMEIDEARSIIGERYFSVVFRFQNLLGDFPEYHFRPLDSELEKEKLIKRCLDKVEELISFEKGMTCLVTADSSLFLRCVEAIEGVKTIPGKVVHPGTGAKGDFHLYSKSFVDFYLLSGSTKIYSIVYGDMYPSEFPLYASKLNNIPFERIIEK